MQVKDKVFILRKTRYGDADLILNCLNPNGARVSFIARSAVKSKKRFGGGVLEPTHYIHVLYDDKSGSSPLEQPLHTLKEASIIDDFPNLRTSYERIEMALHFVRLVSEVVREGEVDAADLFNLLGNALKAAEVSQNLEILRVHFEAKILGNQGVLPIESDEEMFLKTPISEHQKIVISESNLNLLKGRVRRVLRDYLQEYLKTTT